MPITYHDTRTPKFHRTGSDTGNPNGGWLQLRITATDGDPDCPRNTPVSNTTGLQTVPNNPNFHVAENASSSSPYYNGDGDIATTNYTLVLFGFPTVNSDGTLFGVNESAGGAVTATDAVYSLAAYSYNPGANTVIWSSCSFTIPKRDANAWGPIQIQELSGYPFGGKVILDGTTLHLYDGWGGNIGLDLPGTGGAFITNGYNADDAWLGVSHIPSVPVAGTGPGFYLVKTAETFSGTFSPVSSGGATPYSITGAWFSNFYNYDTGVATGPVAINTDCGYTYWGVSKAVRSIGGFGDESIVLQFRELACTSPNRSNLITTLTIIQHDIGVMPPAPMMGKPLAGDVFLPTHEILLAWIDGSQELKTAAHLAPTLGSGAMGWEATVTVESANASAPGVIFTPSGRCRLTFISSGMDKQRLNDALGLGPIGNWQAAAARSDSGQPSAVGVDAQGLGWYFIADGDDSAGALAFSRCRDPVAMDWAGSTVVASGTVRGPYCGGAWVGNGWGALWTRHSDGKAFWSFSPDGLTWVTPADVSMTGWVVGIAKLAHNTLVALIWDNGTGSGATGAFYAARSYDLGATWKKDSSAITAIPASTTVAPIVLGFDGLAIAEWIDGSGNPIYAASADAGKTWS